MKMSRKNKLQVVAVDNSYYIEWNSFVEIYKTCSKEPYTVLVNDTTLSSSNHLRFKLINKEEVLEEKGYR